MNEIVYSKEHPEFLTVTCLEWKHILMEDRFKDIIMESLSFLSKAKRVCVYGFVIMSNHFHLIWQMRGDNKRDAVQPCLCWCSSPTNEMSPRLCWCCVKGVAGRFTNKQTELGINLLQNKEMIVKECGFKYIQTKGR